MDNANIIKKIWPSWELENLIGKGAYGEVFKVSKKRYGIEENQAVKVVRIPSTEEEFKFIKNSYGLDDKETLEYLYPEVEKLKKEIEIMMSLSRMSQNIVQIHDFEIVELKEENCWYILFRMELLTSLDEYIKNTNLKIADILNLGISILSALKECEENSIIHRDVKFGNLFVNDRGVYKLGDFGVAKDIGKTRSLSHRGTDNYMAPEIYRGLNYGSNVDIYSLGIVMYRLLNNGRYPFISAMGEKVTARSVEEAFSKRYKGKSLPAPYQGEKALTDIILKMCAYSPNNRYISASDVLGDLIVYKESADLLVLSENLFITLSEGENKSSNKNNVGNTTFNGKYPTKFMDTDSEFTRFLDEEKTPILKNVDNRKSKRMSSLIKIILFVLVLFVGFNNIYLLFLISFISICVYGVKKNRKN